MNYRVRKRDSDTDVVNWGAEQDDPKTWEEAQEDVREYLAQVIQGVSGILAAETFEHYRALIDDPDRNCSAKHAKSLADKVEEMLIDHLNYLDFCRHKEATRKG